MVSVVVDTSVLVEEIRTGSELWLKLKNKSKLGKIILICPSIILTELWAGQSMNKVKAVQFVENMLEIVTVIDVGEELAKGAGGIIRKYKISGFDAIVVETCLKYEAELATLNTKHFVGIKGLKLYNSDK